MLTVHITIITEPVQYATYSHAIKVTVDGPREPRSEFKREREGWRERERERENKATTLLSTCRDNKGLELKHGVIALETQFYSCCFFHSMFIKVVSCYHGYRYVQTVMTTIDKKYQQLNDILRFYQ